MSTHLIVNADDYGRTPGVSRGIRHAHRHGIVTSTTAMMNMPGAAEDLRLALQETPSLGLGVHLVLTSGRPLLPPKQVPSLVNEQGAFHSLAVFAERCGTLNLAEVQAEWQAQVEKFIAATGRRPTHLDSHHHVSYLAEGLFRTMLEMAQAYGAAIRLPASLESADSLAGLPSEILEPAQEYSQRLLAEFQPRRPGAFFATFYDEGARPAELIRIFDRLQGLDLAAEIMCHPGYADPELLSGSAYARQRQGELEILTDPAVRAAIEQRDIQLVSFANL